MELSFLKKEIIEFFLEYWHDDPLKTKEMIDGDRDSVQATLGE